MNYRSLADLNDSIVSNLYRLPRDIDVMVGLRSRGPLAANLLSLVATIPLTGFDSFLDGRICTSGTTKRSARLERGFGDMRRILILNDSINSGEALVRACLSARCTVARRDAAANAQPAPPAQGRQPRYRRAREGHRPRHAGREHLQDPQEPGPAATAELTSRDTRRLKHSISVILTTYNRAGLIVRRRVYDEVGPFDEELVRSQDYEMLLRIARRYPGLMLPEVVFLHREHSGVRGTATVSFSASENADRWARFNRDIFTRVLDSLADHELLAPSDLAALPEAQRPRACRIKRGCVLARQRMWTEAVKAWRQAAAMDATPLSWLERDFLARSPNSALGAPKLFDNPKFGQVSPSCRGNRCPGRRSRTSCAGRRAGISGRRFRPATSAV